MRIDRSFDWLGRFPLAVDLADTVRVVQGEEVELLVDDEALSAWAAAASARHPIARAAMGHLPRVLELRDAVRSLLLADASGDSLPARHVETLNETSARCPSYPILDGEGRTMTVELSDDGYEVFAARVARSTFDVLGREPSALVVCQAPSCGMLFVPGNRRQRWCSPRCGNRARVARHAVRAGRGR